MWIIGVFTPDGSTALTVMPYSVTSCANDVTSTTTPALTATQWPELVAPVPATIEEVRRRRTPRCRRLRERA
ncbi:hypothetical protein A5654_03405 [Mycolicibacterium fortuitum]|nr:hypothetical protein A5654_03405 [Mycolicibacterium fortuitum]